MWTWPRAGAGDGRARAGRSERPSRPAPAPGPAGDGRAALGGRRRRGARPGGGRAGRGATGPATSSARGARRRRRDRLTAVLGVVEVPGRGRPRSRGGGRGAHAPDGGAHEGVVAGGWSSEGHRSADLVPQGAAQLGAGPVEAGGHGAGGHAEDLGTASWSKPSPSTSTTVTRWAGGSSARAWRTTSAVVTTWAGRTGCASGLGAERVALAPADLVDAGVVGDPVQPPAEVAAGPEPGEARVGPR